MKTERKQLLVKLLKEYKASKKVIKQSSHDDFMLNYRDQLRKAVKQLNDMQKKYNSIDWQKIESKLDRTMSKYDKNVADFIDGEIGARHPSTLRDIADFAISNMNRYGTQPQFVIDAIDDFYDIVM